MYLFSKRRRAILGALSAWIVGVGTLSAPMRPCEHHPRGTDGPLVGATAHHGHAVAHGPSHESSPKDAGHEPCTCLSQCDTGGAALESPIVTELAVRAPPAPDAHVFARRAIGPRTPLPRVLPFPNPPPLPA